MIPRVQSGEVPSVKMARMSPTFILRQQPCISLSIRMSCSHEIFMRGRSISPDDPCYGYRPLVWMWFGIDCRMTKEMRGISFGFHTMRSGNVFTILLVDSLSSI